MNLKEYIEALKKDDNIFWYLSSGEHQNLLDEALGKIEDLEEKLKKVNGLENIAEL